MLRVQDLAMLAFPVRLYCLKISGVARMTAMLAPGEVLLKVGTGSLQELTRTAVTMSEQVLRTMGMVELLAGLLILLITLDHMPCRYKEDSRRFAAVEPRCGSSS